MNVTLASLTSLPLRPARQSRIINRTQVRTIGGSSMAALKCNDGKPFTTEMVAHCADPKVMNRRLRPQQT
jgi:hypothetical protein